MVLGHLATTLSSSRNSLISEYITVLCASVVLRTTTMLRRLGALRVVLRANAAGPDAPGQDVITLRAKDDLVARYMDTRKDARHHLEDALLSRLQDLDALAGDAPDPDVKAFRRRWGNPPVVVVFHAVKQP